MRGFAETVPTRRSAYPPKKEFSFERSLRIGVTPRIRASARCQYCSSTRLFAMRRSERPEVVDDEVHGRNHGRRQEKAAPVWPAEYLDGEMHEPSVERDTEAGRNRKAGQ